MKNRWAFWLILFCCILVLLIIAAQFAWSWDPRANSIPAVSEPASSAAPSSSSEAAASGASSRSGSASGAPEEAEGQEETDEILEEYDERQRMRELAQQAIDEINRAVAEGREPDLTKEEGYALMMDNSKEALEAIDKIAKPVPWPSYTPEEPEQFQEGEGETNSHYAVGYDPDTGEEFIVG